MLKLAILLENSVKIISDLQSEHGLSIYLECDNLNVIFDMGNTDLYLQNAKKLGVNLEDIDWIVFSHHHYDHVGGLKYFHSQKKTKLLAQKYAFYQRRDDPNLLLDSNLKEYDVVVADSDPIELSQNLVFLARIPRLNNFECQTGFDGEKVLLSDQQTEDDFCFEDSALIYGSLDGIVIITGCSHSGICNIVHYAKRIAKEKWNIPNVKSVIGGLHLIDTAPDFLQKTIDLLREYGVSEIYPCHCTDLAAKIALSKAGFQVKEASSGTVLQF